MFNPLKNKNNFHSIYKPQALEAKDALKISKHRSAVLRKRRGEKGKRNTSRTSRTSLTPSPEI